MDLKVALLLICCGSVLAYEDVTLVEYINTHSFIFLKNLIQQAGLEDVLSQTGPYTFFAPTDAAFAKLGTDTLNSYSSTQLKSIVRYHIVDGYTLVPMVSSADNYPTLLGETVRISPTRNSLLLNNISTVDINSQDNIVNNGVVQPVDTVLMPPDKYLSAETLAQILIKDDEKFKDIFLAFMMAEMINILEHNEFTVFAPTDQAFLWGNQVVLDPNSPNAQQVYQEVLKYHIIPGAYALEDLTDGMELYTLHGTKMTITIIDDGGDEDGLYVDNALVVVGDIFASNGFVHAINKVLVPEDLRVTFPPFPTTTAATES